MSVKRILLAIAVLLTATTPALLRADAPGRTGLPLVPPSAAPATRPAPSPLPGGPLTAPGSPGTNARRSPIVEAVDRVRGAVVNIHSERSAQVQNAVDAQGLVPSQNRINGMGSGVIIDPRGYIVTNYHVVEDVQLLRVRLNDGAAYAARVLARDQETDLALLKIDAPRQLPVMPIGTAADLMVGETVIAVGNAYGYEHTVTVGIVSAINRDVSVTKDISYKSLIQTDASINPGNSGGPLLNINGDLVGVNVAIRAGAQGIGFAIPVDMVIRQLGEMLRKQQAARHGLAYKDCIELNSEDERTDRSRSPSYTLTVSHSVPSGAPRRTVVVDRVEPKSAAATAGFEPGDVLVSVAGLSIGSSLDMERALLDQASGKPLAVSVRRRGGEQHLELVLQPGLISAGNPAEITWNKLGIRVVPVPPEQVSASHPQLHGGMLITDISPGSPAGRAGLQRGDILVGLHQWETLTVENVSFVLTHPDLATFSPVRFYVIRAGQIHRGWLQNIE